MHLFLSRNIFYKIYKLNVAFNTSLCPMCRININNFPKPNRYNLFYIKSSKFCLIIIILRKPLYFIYINF